ncbi:MAG: hypothetical protein ACOCUU_01310 [Nanoarchaeota archaeon]
MQNMTEINELTGFSIWLLQNIGEIALWLSAAGLVVVFWIIFQIMNLILNKKKKKTLQFIQEDLQRVEKKIDKLLKNKK